MILRRLGRNLREQNWTAITIEFVLLVLGVFLGIQAQDWQNELANRRLERGYVERMLKDIELSIETDELNITRLEGLSDGQALVVASLVRCELPADRRDAFADGVSDIAKVGPSVFVMNTMDEMLSAGHFSLIRNAGVRDAMNGLARDAKYQGGLFAAIYAQLAASASTTSQRAIRIYADHKNPFDPVGWNELSIDFDALCKDRAFQAAVSNIRYLTDAQISLNQRAIVALKKAKAVLERDLGRPSAPDGASS
jgi:hypothetical protein